MKLSFQYFLLLGLALLLTSCGDDGPRVCKQSDYVGSYLGSKMGTLCVNDDKFVFEVTPGPSDSELVIDNNVVSFTGCDIFTEAGSFGVGERYEGYLDGDSLIVIQEAGTSFATVRCTWRGLRQ